MLAEAGPMPVAGACVGPGTGVGADKLKITCCVGGWYPNRTAWEAVRGLRTGGVARNSDCDVGTT